MQIERVEYTESNYRGHLLARLLGHVFHVTSQDRFDLIRKKGAVLCKPGKPYNDNPGSSEHSFARKMGWVSLFDLRWQNQQIIDDCLERYYFLAPGWFAEVADDFDEYRLAYLFINPTEFARLVSHEEGNAISPYGHYVPKCECWYPGDIPLSHVHKVLLVKIKIDIPQDSLYIRALRKMKNKDKL